MELHIDTTTQGVIKLELRDKGNRTARFQKNTKKISESLLVEIDKLLKKNRLKFSQFDKISVNPGPGGFSSTRTGVAAANALNFVLGKDAVVLPKYGKAPNISTPHPTLSPLGARGKYRK